jgi:two-component system response regulator (stage 0 sporulation protein A)
MADTNLIFRTLLKFNSKTNMSGFKYLQKALEIILDDPDNYKDKLFITKTIYPEVAKSFGSTAGRVERSIRTYISNGYDDNSPVFHQNGFNFKPTNSHFISNIALYITYDNHITQ